MTDITFHGGVGEIGGNKFLVNDKGTKIFMDFGMSFTAEGDYFAEFLKPRGSNNLKDLIELGILPNIKGLYRRDYARHMGLGGDEETEFSGILLTHAHVDHCAYIRYLRPEIPIYCSEESKLIMQNFDETGQGEQYLTHKEKFEIHKSKKGDVVKDTGKDVEKIDRNITTFTSHKKFNIDSITVNPLPVDHSLPGVHGFVLETSGGVVANTGDLRFHGRREKDTEKFVEQCSESSIDLMLCEGTRVDKSPSITEYEVEGEIAKAVNQTEQLVICGYPIRDLDRLQSFYLAAKKTGRYLVIEPKQAYLLKLFSESSRLKGMYPDPKDQHLKIYMPRQGWGLIDKDISVFTEKLRDADYPPWARDFLNYDNMVDYRDISKNQKEMMFSLSDFKLQELIDIKPNEGSSYVRSLTEPFNEEMKLGKQRTINWFEKFRVISSEKDWHHVHVSGHGDGEQIKRVIDGSNAKKLIPIHTDPANEQYHKKWHNTVQSVKQHDTVTVEV